MAVFGDDADERLLVYDVRNAGTVCDYTISEVNVDSRYNVPKAQNVSLANGTVDLTVTAAFVNELKTGDSFVSVSEQGGRFTPVFDEKPLAGAEFEIVAAEDIVTADGTLRLHAGEAADVLVTDENGYAVSKLLYLGKYEICEKIAPEGYVMDGTPQIAELSYVGQAANRRW